jgi:hypothetical protein
MLTVMGQVVAAPATPAKAPTPAPKTKAEAKTTSSSALSKYQRERLEAFKNSAPADEYFGKMKMSYLGMNNTFHDATIMSGLHTTNPGIISKVAFAEDALADWERRYPHDPQLARTYYLAIRSEQRIWLEPNQQRAWIYMNRIVKVFPNSYFAKQVKKDMAIGFTEHYYGEAQMCATPAPAVAVASATPTEDPRRGRGKEAAATPQPTTAPTPEPTPSTAPTPRVLAKGLKAQVETPPCVPPAPATNPG